jgi:nucleoside-specific channel-forming protein
MRSSLKLLCGAVFAAIAALPAAAADYTDGNIHKNDYKWMQVNFMDSEKARIPFNAQSDTYMELEFGGRSGIVDFYGYVDWFDLFNRPSDQRHASGSNDNDNSFAKLAPRISLDALTHSNLAFGPVQELYIASEFDIGDRRLWENYIGLGADVKMPWLGKVGVNLMKRYVRENYGAANENNWDGYQLATNYFKPFVFFKDKSFIAYQGYLDYKFGANKIKDDGLHADNSIEWFHGFYWHSDRYAVGYGLKYFHNMALVKDGGSAFPGNKQDTSGFGHYFSMTYKF